jgi:16S rRNA (guanine966-N2)-methyltransferase
VRIVAGELKGRTLRGPTGPGVRPTSDGLRETLFNVIGARVEGARVLDAFAGTGAVGLEALSRGAVHATFVERDRRALAVLDRNIAACRVEGRSRVIRQDVMRLDPNAGLLRAFDIVFLDPPYDIGEIEKSIDRAAGWVGSRGLLVLEHSRRRPTPEAAGRLTRHRLLTAGDSALSFYADALTG